MFKITRSVVTMFKGTKSLLSLYIIIKFIYVLVLQPIPIPI